MPVLKIYGKEITSVFQLLGDKENDITYSIGWTLSQSEQFLKMLLNKAFNKEFKSVDSTIIRLQSYQMEGGYTDVEIEQPGEFYLMIEAKKGWKFPCKKQLEDYEARKDFREVIDDRKKIIVLTEANQEYTKKYFKIKDVNGIEVIVLSYNDVFEFLGIVSNGASHNEKRTINQLKKYLKNTIKMRDVTSNQVYVVSLGADIPNFSTISWRQIVNEKSIYFHPVGGNGWPVEPPNYIAFRYDGRLQSIHYIKDYKVIQNPKELGLEFQDRDWEPHYVYELGDAIKPSKIVKTGTGIFRNGRVWCALDLLLTCDQIDEARDKTKERMNSGNF